MSASLRSSSATNVPPTGLQLGPERPATAPANGWQGIADQRHRAAGRPTGRILLTAASGQRRTRTR